MNTRMTWAVVSSLLLGLSGCDGSQATAGQGGSGGTGSGGTGGGPTTAAAVNGDWQSLSCEVRPSPNGPVTLTRKIHLDSGKMSLEFLYYADDACKKPNLTLWFDGDYQTLGASGDVEGALEANLNVTRVSARPESDGAVKLLASAGKGACGAGDWSVGTKQDITPTGCAPLGVAANQVTHEYELLYVFRDQIFFGARPVDGSYLSSPDKRPKALLVPAKRVSP